MEMQKISALVTIIMISINSFCQQGISLPSKLENNQIKAINRSISLFGDQQDAVEMNAKNGSGIGIIKDVEFEKGIIEIEFLGENNPGKSFIGIAFNIQDDKTYEAIYFRPFNFVAKEQIRKEHMVQYIYHPEFTWKKLRKEKTGEFENEIKMPPNPDDWFKAIIHIDEKKVKVFINDVPQPILIVDRLTSTISKKIGIWTGFGSSGRFRNLTLKE
ncbi:hypothetical protein D1816_02080 [Aquimarina sp. AD10]|uniref:hypothetical protein n=1 Tax=Aquimarina sp. AD10 TaxID=1714849 RepID=UPI000E486874|nr:hypothetical protein [Aquimarina sp. AD10]AXT59184.1 hypothetical protein D1816_02080 [Aquimarina sp. AD10]RKM93891.1 hypothetical protein D7033_19105 [Aquimarina sp. AD10]